jgi:hypothetical protein
MDRKDEVLEGVGGDDLDAAVAAETARKDRLVEVFALVSDLGSEKRARVREQVLRKLFRTLSYGAAMDSERDFVRSQWETTIIPACISRGANASPAEQYASCRVLEMTSVVLGDDNMEDYWEALIKPLTQMVKATGRAPAVRCAALRALSMTTFICADGSSEQIAVSNLCEAACAETFRGDVTPATLRATALDCWALLSTTLHDATLAGNSEGVGRGVVLLPLLQQCLNHTSVDLRSAAGECVALIHESRLNLGIVEDGNESTPTNTTERRFRRGSWDGSEWEVMMDEVKQRVAELSNESGHHMSKKAKKEQRATFREFMATIVDDEAPHEEVSVRGGSITLRSWRQVIQLNFIRHCLQGGFQNHLMFNSTLRIMFGITFTVSDRNSQLEKRLLLSKTSDAAKLADKNLTRQRRTRTNVKNHFLTVDGDDI